MNLSNKNEKNQKNLQRMR